MAAKKESSKKANNSTTVWWNQFDLFEEIQNKSKQVIENNQEWIDGTKEQLGQLEEYSKKLTTDWKTNSQKFFTKNKKEPGIQDFHEWFEKLEDIGHKSQQIAFLPGKTSIEILAKSTEQVEKTFENVTEQNKNIREETTNAFDQMQQLQKEMFQLFQFSSTASK